MIVRRDFRLPRPGGGELHAHFRHTGSASPLVIFSHGFSVDGTESHRMFLRMARRYNEAGMATLNFDYFGCGYSDGDFSEFSLTNSITDLHTVIDWAREQPEVDGAHIFVHGQSLGTATAAIVGSHREDIHAFVLWNLSADLERRYRELLGASLFEDGQTCLPDKGFTVNRAFYDDLRQYDVLSYFSAWDRPVLFVSSGSDTKGEPQLARRARDMTGRLGTRVVIENANHSFKCQPVLERQAMDASVTWVASQVQRER